MVCMTCISVNIISDGLRWVYISWRMVKMVMVCMACISVNIISDGLRWGAAQVAAAQILERMQCASPSVQKYIRASWHTENPYDVNLSLSLSHFRSQTDNVNSFIERCLQNKLSPSKQLPSHIFLSSEDPPSYILAHF